MEPTAIRSVIDNGGPSIVFQPIVKLVGRPTVEGYEALSRFPDMARPDHWFHAAWQAGLGIELEHAAIQNAIYEFRRVLGGFRSELGYLAINISPKGLLDPELRDFLLHIDEEIPIHIVLELSESQIITDYEPIKNTVTELRKVGIALAIDDLGAGFSSLKRVLELHPEHIKIDKELTLNIPHDPYEVALVSAIVVMSRSMGASVTAEGIETEEKADALRFLGVTSGQGYLWARPGPLPDHSP